MSAFRSLLPIVFAALALPAAAQGPPMSEAEGLQLFGAGGFRVADGRALNVCGETAAPKFTFIDLNGDASPEAVATDKSASCYGREGSMFAVLAKDAEGRWRQLARGAGELRFEVTRTNGWQDARVNTDCDRLWAFDGRAYARSARCIDPAGPTMMTGRIVTTTAVPASEYPVIFAAAGFKQRGGKWTGQSPECEAALDPADVRDLNGDGTPEAVIVENGTFCYGMTGQGIYLMSRTAPGRWTLLFQSQGVADFKTTKTGGWPDLVLGGPGFCHPLYKWTGRTYAQSGQVEEEKGACARR